MWQQRAGLGNSPRTILEELARIQSHDIVLPTATHGHGTRRLFVFAFVASIQTLRPRGSFVMSILRMSRHRHIGIICANRAGELGGIDGFLLRPDG
jgi:hypothetical protein